MITSIGSNSSVRESTVTLPSVQASCSRSAPHSTDSVESLRLQTCAASSSSSICSRIWAFLESIVECLSQLLGGPRSSIEQRLSGATEFVGESAASVETANRSSDDSELVLYGEGFILSRLDLLESQNTSGQTFNGAVLIKRSGQIIDLHTGSFTPSTVQGFKDIACRKWGENIRALGRRNETVGAAFEIIIMTSTEPLPNGDRTMHYFESTLGHGFRGSSERGGEYSPDNARRTIAEECGQHGGAENRDDNRAVYQQLLQYFGLTVS